MPKEHVCVASQFFSDSPFSPDGDGRHTMRLPVLLRQENAVTMVCGVKAEGPVGNKQRDGSGLESFRGFNKRVRTVSESSQV